MPYQPWLFHFSAIPQYCPYTVNFRGTIETWNVLNVLSMSFYSKTLILNDIPLYESFPHWILSVSLKQNKTESEFYPS